MSDLFLKSFGTLFSSVEVFFSQPFYLYEMFFIFSEQSGYTMTLIRGLSHRAGGGEQCGIRLLF